MKKTMKKTAAALHLLCVLVGADAAARGKARYASLTQDGRFIWQLVGVLAT